MEHGRTVVDRAGQVHTYAPIVGPRQHISARFLSEDERITIADRLVHGASIRAIAAELGRSPSTISREVRRNSDPLSVVYHLFRAHQRARGRRARPKAARLMTEVDLRQFVQHHLERRWSPEQIGNVLPMRFPDQPRMRVAPETITSPSVEDMVNSDAS
ncbi:transposase [Dactylosporangium sp. CS-047395]|uniref:transposase n=1 Tax=Dactylosporangium sp. CS-047395 TaxID=3239936 RepID=UPI003D8E14C7